MSENNWKSRFGDILRNQNVTIMFIVMCLFAYYASGTTLTYLMPELITRIGRNTFMVLSLLIPVVAGLGLNFGIVIGAIAAQISIFLVVLWGFTGLTGLLLCVLLCTPMAIFFGYLVGRLFNSMKGTEMIGGLVSGYFSDGLYQFLFLFILGGVIKIDNPTLMISTGVGVKNAINLKDNLKYALDDIPMITLVDLAFYIGVAVTAIMLVYRLVKKQDLRLQSTLLKLLPVVVIYGLSFISAVYDFLATPRLLLLHAIEGGVVLGIVYCIIRMIRKRGAGNKKLPVQEIAYIVIAIAVYGLTYIDSFYAALIAVHLPVMTFACITALCLFMAWFMNTKLGQEMRTVGQNRAVASSAGIDVDKTRIIAMIMSTVLASWGQLISLQNIGTVATYGSHQQVGLYAVAALLVGGASQHKANATQALLGIILFHTLFILAPVAGKVLLGNAQIGEYFRVFVAYGVIALSLIMHNWRSESQSKKDARDRAAKEAEAG